MVVLAVLVVLLQQLCLSFKISLLWRVYTTRTTIPLRVGYDQEIARYSSRSCS